MSITMPPEVKGGELNEVWRALLILWRYRAQYRYWDSVRWLVQTCLHDLQRQGREPP